VRAAVAGALAAMALAGCVVGPNYQRPAIALRPDYRNAAVQPASLSPSREGGLRTAAPVPPSQPALAPDWWAGFGDAGLNRVVARALAGNLDIAQAEARLQQSRAQARAAAAALLPAGDAGASAANQQQSLRSPLGDLIQHAPGYKRVTDVYDLGLGASWELDAFGGLTRARQGARAGARASLDDLAAVRVAVAAETADAYLQVRAYQARLAVARRQENVESDLVDLLNRRTGEGVASDRERHEARAALAGVRVTIPPLAAALEAELNRLDILMGAQAGTWRAELASPAPIPAPPAVSAAEGPPALLRRRPDIAAAEQRLIAANAAIGAAISGYYPKVSISGLLGLESLNTTDLFTGQAAQHQVAAGLRWRLFDFGRVDAEVAEARGRYAESLAAWRAAVLTATGEVETALSDLTQDEARIRTLAAQVAELQADRTQAETAYEGGVISLIEVRDADRDLLAASDQLVQTRAAAARDAVAAYRALGGGWNG
jgi:NodT family efflux transporter outer membrane factor (OMF) lipoprotein